MLSVTRWKVQCMLFRGIPNKAIEAAKASCPVSGPDFEGFPIHPHRNGPYKPFAFFFGVPLSWFLRLCWFMIYRTRNITFGVPLSWFLRLCWFMIYRTRNITFGVRLSWFLRLCRMNRIALCPDEIMRCTLRMSTDRTDRTNRNALCPHVIMRCTLRMCSAYGPLVIVTVCAEYCQNTVSNGYPRCTVIWIQEPGNCFLVDWSAISSGVWNSEFRPGCS